MTFLGRGLLCHLPICLAFAAALIVPGAPPDGEPVPLFAGQSLENFDTFVFGQGFNRDPEGVFSLVDGMIRVEGIPYGYFITK